MNDDIYAPYHPEKAKPLYETALAFAQDGLGEEHRLTR